MSNRLATVLGVAQVPMRTRLPQYTYADLLSIVAHGALADAGVDAKDVDGLILAMAPTTTLGVDEPQFWGADGLPGMHNFLGRVHMLAASGFVAFRLACAHVAAGRAKRLLVVSADLADESPDLIAAITMFSSPFAEKHYPNNATTAHAFEMAAYMVRNKLSERDMAHVVVKNRMNGIDNEYAQIRAPITVDEVLESPVLSWPIKRSDASPRTSGAAAVLIGPGSEKGVAATGFGSFANHPVSGARMVPGLDESYLDAACMRKASAIAYKMAGVERPHEEIDIAEVYASFGIIELLSIEGMGLAGDGVAAAMIRDGHFHRDSRMPVNPSGGATCGSPISGTGLLRVIEATLQLRGTAGARQMTRTPRRAAVSAIGGLFQLQEVGVLET